MLCLVRGLSKEKNRSQKIVVEAIRSGKVGKVKVSGQTQGRIENVLGKDEKEGDVTWIFRQTRRRSDGSREGAEWISLSQDWCC